MNERADDQASDSKALKVQGNLEIQEVAEDISQNLWKKLSPTDRQDLNDLARREPEVFKESIDSLTTAVSKVLKNEFETPTLAEILETADPDQKAQSVSQRLEYLAALSLADPENVNVRNKYAWGRHLNDMILFAGGGVSGREVVYDALSALNEAERALVMSQMSMSKRWELQMIDIDTASERTLSLFINTAVYEFSRDEARIDDMETIITSIDQRTGLPNFDPGLVIESIIENYNDPEYVFDKLIEGARQANFEAELTALFSSHPATFSLCRELEQASEGTKIVPWDKQV